MLPSYRQGHLSRSPTLILIITNLVVYALLQVDGDLFYPLLSEVGVLIFQAHFYWQLVTAMFVHFGILHIIFNMYGLYYFGRLNEMHFTPMKFFAIYFGSGILGNLASLFLIPATVPSGGASGAIFGLVGSYVALERKAQNLGVALGYAILIFLISSGGNANIFAHLFGLVGGIALGMLFTSERYVEVIA